MRVRLLYSQWIELFSPISPLVCPLACREVPISPSSRAMSHSVRCSFVFISVKCFCVVDKKGEDEDLPSSPLPRNAVDPRAEHVCESSFPRLSGGNRESRWACHNVIYETPRGCLQHPAGTARRGRAMAPTPEVSLTPPCGASVNGCPGGNKGAAFVDFV